MRKYTFEELHEFAHKVKTDTLEPEDLNPDIAETFVCLIDEIYWLKGALHNLTMDFDSAIPTIREGLAKIKRGS